MPAVSRPGGARPRVSSLGRGPACAGAPPAPARASPRLEQRLPAGVEADHTGADRKERQVAPGAAAHVEHAPARTAREPPAPAPKTRRLRQRHEGVVEPGDLLDAP